VILARDFQSSFALNLIAMTLRVDNNSIIVEIQERFQLLFPDLKLEFFFSDSERLSTSSRLIRSFPYISVGDLCGRTEEHNLDISDEMTVSELEFRFKELFGLPARIFQKVGEYWAKNSSLDCLRLRHNNFVIS